MMMKFWNAAIWSNFSAHSPAISPSAPSMAAPSTENTTTHTGDFGPRSGTLRLDYVLPSRGFGLAGSGVFWPAPDAPAAAIAGGSDHHLAWVDLLAPGPTD